MRHGRGDQARARSRHGSDRQEERSHAGTDPDEWRADKWRSQNTDSELLAKIRQDPAGNELAAGLTGKQILDRIGWADTLPAR
jgi:hypothetical protein